MTRRTLLIGLALLALPAAAEAAGPILVHRDPGCGCCEKWVAQLRRQLGRPVQVVDDRARAAFQRAHGVPTDLSSCHTAIVDGLAIEGHVPIADIRRALAARSKGLAGLAVPGMPIGSPGMEVPGGRVQAYQVVAFGPAGRRVFARHGG